MGETIQDTARREVFEETGLHLEELELFSIHSGPQYDKIFPNGDRISLLLIIFVCRNYKGKLIGNSEESVQNKFFSLEEMPENLFTEHKMLVDAILVRETASLYWITNNRYKTAFRCFRHSSAAC